MARAAHRWRRTALVRARLAAALAAALAVPAMALAVTAAPVTAGPTAIAASPTVGATSPGGPSPSQPPPATPSPTTPPPTEPPPTEPPPTEPPPTTPRFTRSPVDPAEPPAHPTDPHATNAPAGPMPPPSARPPGRQGPVRPGQPRLGVFVSTSDVNLPLAYWNSPATVTELLVTVENTGSVAERVQLSYTLPAGLTDAGTRGCSSIGGSSYRCEGWTVDAGTRWSTRITVRVAREAWKSMPLNGSVQVTATAPNYPDAGDVHDDQGFAVLFPAGPPIAGMTLSADEVVFDVSGRPSWLQVRLGNTDRTDATGRVEIILPEGVTVSAPPAGCRALAAERTACDLSLVRAGRTAHVRLPISATAEAQRRATLSGAVIATLTPRAGAVKRMQMSFRITAAAAMSTPSAESPAATGAQGVVAAANGSSGGRGNGVQRLAISLIAVSVLLVVLALTLAVTSLRRRLADEPPPAPLSAPAPAD
ncbi:MAG TPA: hypothetical protein VHN18_00405 [Micromonosporaceae bacterium]|nr:hypothetical protein [Micromonosporaceae bacterium]